MNYWPLQPGILSFAYAQDKLCFAPLNDTLSLVSPIEGEMTLHRPGILRRPDTIGAPLNDTGDVWIPAGVYTHGTVSAGMTTWKGRV